MFQKSTIKGTLLGFDYMGKEGRGKRKGNGIIINHADTAALDALPYIPGYVATKAGIIYGTLSFGVSILVEDSVNLSFLQSLCGTHGARSIAREVRGLRSPIGFKPSGVN